MRKKRKYVNNTVKTAMRREIEDYLPTQRGKALDGAELFRQAGVSAAAVSGSMKRSEREEFRERFIHRGKPAALPD